MPWRIIGLSLVLALAGCASFSPASLSEKTLEGYLRDQVARFDREQLESGSPLSMSLNQVDMTVGPEGRPVIRLAVAGEVALNLMVTRVPVNVFLDVEGTPVLDATEKAIYIRRLSLLDSRVESDYLNQDLQPATRQLMGAVSRLLETMPVYRLEEGSLAANAVDLMDLTLQVEPGRLVLVPAGE